MPSLKIALLSTLLILPVTLPGNAASPGAPLVAVELETNEHTLDGCTACGCRTQGAFEPGTQGAWWITFGLVSSDAYKGWAAGGSSSHCGSGTFEKVAADFSRTVGIPYVILELAATAAVLPAGDIDLQTGLRLQKLSGFDDKGRPVYDDRIQKRELRFAAQGEITLPLMVRDRRAQQSFGVHEVLVRLRATALKQKTAAAYGMIAVSADVPGAEVFLDGGLVGRIAEGRPILLENVLAGTREIRVRDYSGREAHRRVTVEENGTEEVALMVLDLPPAAPGEDLASLGDNPQGQAEYWRVKDGALVMGIPAGEFLRGSPEGEGDPHERPQQPVYVSAFLIDKTEVTWRQFRKFLEANATKVPRTPIWGAPDHYPAAFVLWEEAKGYCQWVGGRLPTEAEWEKAARGPDGRRYPWGDTWDLLRCNSISGGPHRPRSVGSFPRCLSPYGVLDMAGSMWEWCADWYGEGYYAEGPLQDPQGPTSGSLRVMRGGAWMSQPLWLRTAYRAKRSPTSRNHNHGFRCAQDTPE